MWFRVSKAGYIYYIIFFFLIKSCSYKHFFLFQFGLLNYYNDFYSCANFLKKLEIQKMNLFITRRKE